MQYTSVTNVGFCVTHAVAQVGFSSKFWCILASMAKPDMPYLAHCSLKCYSVEQDRMYDVCSFGLMNAWYISFFGAWCSWGMSCFLCTWSLYPFTFSAVRVFFVNGKAGDCLCRVWCRLLRSLPARKFVLVRLLAAWGAWVVQISMWIFNN